MALELGAITGKVAQQVVVLAGIFSYVNTVTSVSYTHLTLPTKRIV